MRGLYFLHIPKTAGSSLTRVLDDAWPAGALASERFVEDLCAMPREELDRYEVTAGHFGLLPAVQRPTVITVLRDPLARAWSHYRAYDQLRAGPRANADELPKFESFGAFLDDPVYGWMARDYQARWLAIPPRPDERLPVGLPPGIPYSNGGAPVASPDDELERRALETLARCRLVGTAERLDDFVEALARLLGRPLAPPPRLNVSPHGPPVTQAEARRVYALSQVDSRLHAAAGAALDRALATLAPLPPEPQADSPYQQVMSDAFHGTGWHARTHTPEAGWHRWTGPGTRAELRLPVRIAGPARLEVAILSACDDDAVKSLRVSVQERPIAHRLEEGAVGVLALADVELNPRRPLILAFETAQTRHLVDAVTGERSTDRAGLAIGTVSLRRAG